MNPVKSGKLVRLIGWPIDADPHRRIALRTRGKFILAPYTLDCGQARQYLGHHFFHLGPGCWNLVEIHRAVSRQLLQHHSQLRVQLVDEVHSWISLGDAELMSRSLSHDSERI